MKKYFFINIVGIFFLSLFITPQALAANSTIDVSPLDGSFSEPFKVDIIVDGHGDVFNAAESTVVLSSNLTIQNLTLGDCNFSYLDTPSEENPSFSGIILSGSSKKCTAYTMTLAPNAKGNATITLSRGSVRRYGDAVNVLSSVHGASYALTGVVKTPSKKLGESPNPLYTINIHVLAKASQPLVGANIMLASSSAKAQTKKNTDNNGKTQFANIQPGVYFATVEQNNKTVAKTIINVKGSNHTLTFSINLENQKNNPLLGNATINILGMPPIYLIIILVAGIAIGVGTALIIIKIRTK